MLEINGEHVLLIMIIIFLLYNFVGNCRCDGFSVGGLKGKLEGK